MVLFINHLKDNLMLSKKFDYMKLSNRKFKKLLVLKVSIMTSPNNDLYSSFTDT